MTDEAICSAVGPAPENPIPLLSEFRQEGVLRTEGRAVALLAPERIKALTLECPEYPLLRGY
ncbi:MAG TPA: hypothetical protein VLG48_05165 [Candidatus Methylomirabilis sp.]|nr:hypothetical protein [Candidatus Methylomirabilis sp.]